MSFYNILFPFLILLAIGVIIYVLTRHFPEIAEKEEAPVEVEKKRWWQMILGKGEGILGSFRVFLFKIDTRLSNSIKKVREKKNKMGQGIKDYRLKHRIKEEKPVIDENKNYYENLEQNKNDLEKSKDSLPDKTAEESTESQKESIGSQEEIDLQKKENLFSELAEQKKANSKFSLVKNFFHKNDFPVSGRTVEEIVKKNFTPNEIKVETREYWKKKEEMLIQSVVREPKNINLYLQLGRLYMNQHNWEDAKNAFLEVLKLDRTNIKAKEELKRIEKKELEEKY